MSLICLTARESVNSSHALTVKISVVLLQLKVHGSFSPCGLLNTILTDHLHFPGVYIHLSFTLCTNLRQITLGGSGTALQVHYKDFHAAFDAHLGHLDLFLKSITFIINSGRAEALSVVG